MTRRDDRDAWEDWARVDPLWAILTEPEARHGRWDPEEFFATGHRTVEALLDKARELGAPTAYRVAVDFGCGVGRLTRALSAYFDQTYGLDISPIMVRQAKTLNRGVPRCTFLVHDDDDLGRITDGSVDLVCCFLVLQHMPDRSSIATYLREFVRVLAPGGLAVLQLPTRVPDPPKPTLRHRLAIRRRFTRMLRRAGVSPRWLYERFGWMPDMAMTALPRMETTAILGEAGGAVLAVSEPTADHGGVESLVYYVTKRNR